jgi:hypothetical protein
LPNEVVAGINSNNLEFTNLFIVRHAISKMHSSFTNHDIFRNYMLSHLNESINYADLYQNVFDVDFRLLLFITYKSVEIYNSDLSLNEGTRISLSLTHQFLTDMLFANLRVKKSLVGFNGSLYLEGQNNFDIESIHRVHYVLEKKSVMLWLCHFTFKTLLS